MPSASTQRNQEEKDENEHISKFPTGNKNSPKKCCHKADENSMLKKLK